MDTLKLIAEQNRQQILDNRQIIVESQHLIEKNTDAINELKINHLPFAVFEKTIETYSKTVRGLIMALCLIVALLLISNAVWIYMWSKLDFSDSHTVVNKGGVSNVIGQDGQIGE